MEEAALTDVNWIWTHGPFTWSCEGSNVSAIVNYSKVPVFKIHDYIDKNASLEVH
jgi:selenide,water dikinase